MSHVQDFRIGSFRGLEEVELARLARINLVVGGNNQGKTTVLEALGIFAAPTDLVEWAGIARLREVRGPASATDALSGIEAIRWLFAQRGASDDMAEEPRSLSLYGNGHWLVRSVEATCLSIRGIAPESRSYKYRSSEANEDPVEEQGWEIKGTVGVQTRQSDLLEQDHGNFEYISFGEDLWPSNGFSRAGVNRGLKLRCIALGPYSHRNQPMQLRLLSRSIIAGEKYQIIELLQGIDKDVLDLEIVTAGPFDRPSLLVVHAKAGRVPGSVLGDGFRRALSIALAIIQAGNGLLLIDEVEAALHVSVLDKVFPWMVRSAEQLNVQVFATTHSLEAIQAITQTIHKGSDGQLAAYHLTGSNGHESPPKRYSSDMLLRLVRDRGLDIR